MMSIADDPPPPESMSKEDQKVILPGIRRRNSNLDSFLSSVTPRVPSTKENNCIECFTLGNLWQCYDEWSSYGVGTPVVLDDGEILTQYFSPHLSAIYICTTLASPFRSSEFASVVSFSDESESDRLSRSTSNNSSGWGEANSEEHLLESAFSSSSFSSSPSMSIFNDKLGQVYMQYFEYSSPFVRIPFSNKIVELGRKHPGLMSLKNVELSPASWMAVAWYPIYQIPSHRTLKDLSTMFLTYHTLSSCFQDDEQADEDSDETIIKQETSSVTLEPFGMSSYRMTGDVWVNEVNDYEKLTSLHSAADSWLKQLDCYHHDFNFIVKRRSSVV